LPAFTKLGADIMPSVSIPLWYGWSSMWLLGGKKFIHSLIWTSEQLQ